MSLLKNLLKTDRKCLKKFILNLGWKGMRGFYKFQKRKKRGEIFPAFQFISVTNDCNLVCQGCWVTKNSKPDSMDLDKINSIIKQSKVYGSYFYGILGGEPLMYKQLFQIFKSHPDCYFQLFTNGTLLNDPIAAELRSCANVTPLISFEGNEEIADIRRGRSNIYMRTLKAVEIATRHKLITGVAISVCKSNIEMALSEDFIHLMHAKGVIYLWYYIYRPTGENPCYELALSAEEIQRLREFIVEGRTRFPLVIIDSYWGADGEPFCPAVEGLSHHINPSGFIEPCPVIQFSSESVNGASLKDIYEKSSYLRSFNTEVDKRTKGCILMENPSWLQEFSRNHQAFNTSNRENFEKELSGAPQLPSHGSCPKIPEKNWIYRVAKRHAFFGLGAYG